MTTIHCRSSKVHWSWAHSGGVHNHKTKYHIHTRQSGALMYKSVPGFEFKCKVAKMIEIRGKTKILGQTASIQCSLCICEVIQHLYVPTHNNKNNKSGSSSSQPTTKEIPKGATQGNTWASSMYSSVDKLTIKDIAPWSDNRWQKKVHWPFTTYKPWIFYQHSICIAKIALEGQTCTTVRVWPHSSGLSNNDVNNTQKCYELGSGCEEPCHGLQ